MHPIIPSALEGPVNQALQVVFGTTQLDSLTPIHEGLSSAIVCRVVVGGRPALLRLERATAPLLSPAQQYAAMITASEAGLAPTVRYTDPQNGVGIMDFIEARLHQLGVMRQICNLFYAMMFIRLVAASRAPDAPPLTDLSAPPLWQVRQGLGTGAVALHRPEGEWLYARALLGEAVEAAARL